MTKRDLLLIIVSAAIALTGCARGGEDGGSVVPAAVLQIVWQMDGPINDSFYYFVAFDADQDQGADFPVPVAAGPYWGNGWGTGSITHFLQYHAGSYELYQADLDIVLREATGGFQQVTGDVTGGNAGVYTLTVTAVTPGNPDIAEVEIQFEAASTGQTTTTTATLPANSTVDAGQSPIPGIGFVTGSFSVGDQAVIALEIGATATLLGPPYEYVLPQGGSTLQATVDLSRLGQNLTNISINFITTTELIFDPQVVNPNENVYDGLGPLGNDAIRVFNPQDFVAISNSTAFIHEEADDTTLTGPATQQEQAAVDIVDWQIVPRRLR